MPSLSKAEVVAILSAQGITSIDDLANQIASTQIDSGAVDLPVATNPNLVGGKTPEQLGKSWVIKVWSLKPAGDLGDLTDLKGGDAIKTAIENSGGLGN